MPDDGGARVMIRPKVDFSGVRVAVLGDVILDEYVYGHVSRISPEAPVPVVEVVTRDRTLGGAGNVARNIRSLGGIVHFFAVRGDDTAGEELETLARSGGLDLSGLIVDSSRPTTFKQRVVARTQQIVRIDLEDVRPIDGEIVRRIVDRMEALAASCDVLIISDYDKGVITKELLDPVIALFASRGRPIVVDPNIPHFFNYRDVTVVTPNHLQLERVSGRRIRSEEELLRTGAEIRSRLGSTSLLITRGEEGMALLDGGTVIRIPTVAREVYDVTGAGDTVVAVLGLALGIGLGLEAAARWANAAAGIVVGKRGTAVLSAAEFEAKLIDLALPSATGTAN